MTTSQQHLTNVANYWSTRSSIQQQAAIDRLLTRINTRKASASSCISTDLPLAESENSTAYAAKLVSEGDRDRIISDPSPGTRAVKAARLATLAADKAEVERINGLIQAGSGQEGSPIASDLLDERDAIVTIQAYYDGA